MFSVGCGAPPSPVQPELPLDVDHGSACQRCRQGTLGRALYWRPLLQMRPQCRYTGTTHEFILLCFPGFAPYNDRTKLLSVMRSHPRFRRIYDAEKLKSTLGDKMHAPEFFNPPSCPFYQVRQPSRHPPPRGMGFGDFARDRASS